MHQLGSTRDPVFELSVPADRILGGYTVEGGVIIPNLSHHDVIDTVLGRTRIPVGLMTAAKLLSTVEPVIRYQRGRFRGGEGMPGTPRHDLGLPRQRRQLSPHTDEIVHKCLCLFARQFGIGSPQVPQPAEPVKFSCPIQ